MENKQIVMVAGGVAIVVAMALGGYYIYKKSNNVSTSGGVTPNMELSWPSSS